MKLVSRPGGVLVHPFFIELGAHTNDVWAGLLPLDDSHRLDRQMALSGYLSRPHKNLAVGICIDNHQMYIGFVPRSADGYINGVPTVEITTNTRNLPPIAGKLAPDVAYDYARAWADPTFNPADRQVPAENRHLGIIIERMLDEGGFMLDDRRIPRGVIRY